ncbi:hypothetical protein, partial [Thiolapillus sp.]|uniref:hypothetical protein n=1 Tax=Thiolapillus sp. TaxID=2017437 RepID=UPI003AF9999C
MYLVWRACRAAGSSSNTPFVKPVFVNKVVRFNHAALSSFCSLARIALGGFNQTFSILSQFL